jgi:hypothetical protein
VTTYANPEAAHRFGLGFSETKRRQLAAKALTELTRSLGDDFARQIMHRAIQQAVDEALPSYWLWRSEAFEQVGTPDADATAVACRRHAWLLAHPGTTEEMPCP